MPKQTDVEKLVEEMVQNLEDNYTFSYELNSKIAKEMLRVVLKAVEEGKVVELHSLTTHFIGTISIVLKPEFKEFLEGGK